MRLSQDRRPSVRRIPKARKSSTHRRDTENKNETPTNGSPVPQSRDLQAARKRELHGQASGVGARRKGPKSLPKLLMSVFSGPPSTGTQETFGLPPSPSHNHP